MNAPHDIDKQLIAHDFRVAMHGKLEPEQIDDAVEALVTSEKAYGATGSVASLIFYLQFQVNITDGKTFDGHAGGASSPGGGALFGHVYTNDLDRLYRDTVSFEFQSTPVYLSVLFFDRHSKLLGHFQSGAVSIVTGIGGGKGSWS
ncbi:VapA/VapB family virulence-associated protein [Halomonas campisalis]|uniref:VapA/VapB family virulence-associated protein n=1 Tax=Billgrantia campisalis TaxID=74661 RepID=A0ABS9P8B4_9GAMM|nr:VapA/VapB family virulence-associated protein [Halomonas campisalis]MCG6658011.1 VapA/VapB family virulence-associated protein [Halomonas campisalis]MDR5864845.1 VapA/VapB family virulence-associated protein [Halomonas campisalis]